MVPTGAQWICDGHGNRSSRLQLSQKSSAAFDAGEPENVIFTPGCTQAINIVLKGLLQSGDHVVVSDLEHNAVMRPLEGMKEQGVTWSAAHVTPGDADATVDAFRKSLRPNTKLMICTHASNVFGIRLPVRRLAALAHAYGVLFAVDAAQSAGVLPLHLREDGIDFICAAGHKGLFGPMGTGLLITEKETYCGRFARVEQEAFPLVCSSLTPCPIDSKAAHKMFLVSAGFRPVLILC